MRTKCITLLAALLVVLPLTGCVTNTAQEGDEAEHVFGTYNFPGPKRRVAVVKFENKAVYGGELGDIAQDVMISELTRSTYFNVYDRGSIPDQLRELRHSSGDFERVKQVKVPLDAIVLGTVTNFGVKASGTDFVVYQQKNQIVEATVDIKVVNHRTGAIVGATSGHAKFTTTSQGAFGSTGQSYDQTLAAKALRLAIDNCIEKVMQMIGSIPPEASQPGGGGNGGPRPPAPDPFDE